MEARIDRVRRPPAEHAANPAAIDTQFADEALDLVYTPCDTTSQPKPGHRHRKQAIRRAQMARQRAHQLGNAQVVAVSDVEGLVRGTRIHRTSNQCISKVLDEHQATTCVDCAERQRDPRRDGSHELLEIGAYTWPVDEWRADDHDLQARFGCIFAQRMLGL
ncbi:hypothetical protein WJ61_24640 [Burkholderia ubonensis]|nr:hypothetical protein WJ61_24640 [Burkholderia ubonensis]